MTTTTKTRAVKMQDGAIYSGDNGRLMCLHCAGQSALYTLRDLSGKRLIKMNSEDAAEWLKFVGRPMKCECGKTAFTK